jgi:hypothetical protein
MYSQQRRLNSCSHTAVLPYSCAVVLRRTLLLYVLVLRLYGTYAFTAYYRFVTHLCHKAVLAPQVMDSGLKI